MDLAVRKGRAMMAWADLGGNRQGIIAVVYGKTGGAVDREAAATTDAVLRAIRGELAEHPVVPTFILGDLNGDPDSFDEYSTLTSELAWTDLGHCGGICASKADQPTCFAANGGANRRDYCLANPEAFAILEKFEVVADDGYDVQQPTGAPSGRETHRTALRKSKLSHVPRN